MNAAGTRRPRWVTGEEARSHTEFSLHGRGDRAPSMLECTRRGVFAIGDVRRGSTKRVAAAVGDGALVVRSIHPPPPEPRAKKLRERSAPAKSRDFSADGSYRPPGVPIPPPPLAGKPGGPSPASA